MTFSYINGTIKNNYVIFNSRILYMRKSYINGTIKNHIKFKKNYTQLVYRYNIFFLRANCSYSSPQSYYNYYS